MDFAILRLCALLKPAKEALRPTSPTAPVSPGDRNRNLTDMAVTIEQVWTLKCSAAALLAAASLSLLPPAGVCPHLARDSRT